MRSPGERSAPRPVLLCILDGWGLAPADPGNAVEAAETPAVDALLASCPHTTIKTSGLDVGLRPGLMGNSEVGHMNLGAGRVVWQEITRIDRAIDDRSFAGKEAFVRGFEHARRTRGRVHLLGLVSDGGVHSAEKHYLALVDAAGARGVPFFVHALLDGRDTPPTSGRGCLARVIERVRAHPKGAVASIAGRYYGMDRDKRWERTRAAYAALIGDEGKPVRDPLAAVEEAYKSGETDEFVKPRVVVDPDGRPVGAIRPGDAVLCFNYRADRMRQITQAIAHPGFAGFERKLLPDLYLAGMTRYDEAVPFPFAFPPQNLDKILGQVVSAAGRRQFRIAETEKYAHVTYFFNGGGETPFPGEDRHLVPSPKVATYDLKPEMSAAEVTEEAVRRIDSGTYDLIVLNYANPDMVGHTGVFAAAVKAVEAADRGVARLREAIDRRGGAMLVTADHGNAEEMIDKTTGGPHTYHTTNPVFLILAGAGAPRAKLRDGGRLADIAPTILDLMGLPIPGEMDGRSLLK